MTQHADRSLRHTDDNTGPTAVDAPKVDPRVAAFSGILSGALAVICTHPLDVARTKAAVERTVRGGAPPRYRGTVSTLRLVFRENGIRGLFFGITPALLSHAPAAGIFFSTYSAVRHNAPRFLPIHPQNPWLETITSSLGAGAGWTATCVLLNPLFVLKTKQQTQQTVKSGQALKYSGLISSLRVIVREEGIRGLYNGMLAGMAGAPGAMIQMPLYEYLKRYNVPANEKPSHAQVAFASATSSVCVGVTMYPIEVVRLRLQAQGGMKSSNASGSSSSSSSTSYSTSTQFSNCSSKSAANNVTATVPSSTSTGSVSAPASISSSPSGASSSTGGGSTAVSREYKGIIDCFRKIYVQEGIRSYYKGIGSSIIRTVPQSAIGLSCYETILRATTYFLQWYNAEPQI